MSNETKITGKLNRFESWEKQSVWDLSNGFRAIESYSTFYGPFITQFQKDGLIVWQCCNGGRDKLPEFAAPWLEAFCNPAIPKLVRCKFEKLF